MKNTAPAPPIEEVAAWLEENKLRAQAWFTVDDLKYLKRGGRISPMAAAMGSMLDIKPVITESREGTLVNVDKIRGRKKSITYLADKFFENEPDHSALVILLHADAPDDAAALKDMILTRDPSLNVRVDNVGPVIGAHCGPGTLAVTFMGRERTV